MYTYIYIYSITRKIFLICFPHVIYTYISTYAHMYTKDFHTCWIGWKKLKLVSPAAFISQRDSLFLLALPMNSSYPEGCANWGPTDQSSSLDLLIIIYVLYLFIFRRLRMTQMSHILCGMPICHHTSLSS